MNVNSFDEGIIHFLNSYAGKSLVLDSVAGIFGSVHMGIVIIIVFLWEWYREDEEAPRRREILMATLIASFVGIVLARGLADLLPFRFRPLHNTALNFQLPYGMRREILVGWSSFPSDHAVLFFLLSTGIFIASRKAGVIALAYTLFIICLPRIYLGIHYPTDILGGMVIGIGIAYLATLDRVRKGLTKDVFTLLQKKPRMFNACLFVVCYLIATVFDDLRAIIKYLLHLPLG